MSVLDRLRGIDSAEDNKTEKKPRKGLKELGLMFGLASFLNLGMAQEAKAQTPDKIKSDKDTTLVVGADSLMNTDSLMRRAVYFVDVAKNLPEMETETKSNINETGRDATYTQNRWNSVAEFSKDGKILETVVSHVYNNDKVTQYVIDHKDNRLEDPNGNPLTPQQAEVALRGTEQGIYDTNKEIKGQAFANSERAKHSQATGMSVTTPTRQTVR